MQVRRYPKIVRNARIKCIDCNAPVTITTDGQYVCVSCGELLVEKRMNGDGGGANGNRTSSL